MKITIKSYFSGRQYPDNTPKPRGWGCGTLTESNVGSGKYISYYIGIPNTIFIGQHFQNSKTTKVKVALAWNSEVLTIADYLPDLPFYLGGFDDIPVTSILMQDHDLQIYNSDGILIDSSSSYDNSYEVVDFEGIRGGVYEIRIKRFSGKGNTWYGVAWTAGNGMCVRINKQFDIFDNFPDILTVPSNNDITLSYGTINDNAYNQAIIHPNYIIDIDNSFELSKTNSADIEFIINPNKLDNYIKRNRQNKMFDLLYFNVNKSIWEKVTNISTDNKFNIKIDNTKKTYALGLVDDKLGPVPEPEPEPEPEPKHTTVAKISYKIDNINLNELNENEQNNIIANTKKIYATKHNIDTESIVVSLLQGSIIINVAITLEGIIKDNETIINNMSDNINNNKTKILKVIEDVTNVSTLSIDEDYANMNINVTDDGPEPLTLNDFTLVAENIPYNGRIINLYVSTTVIEFQDYYNLNMSTDIVGEWGFGDPNSTDVDAEKSAAQSQRDAIITLYSSDANDRFVFYENGFSDTTLNKNISFITATATDDDLYTNVTTFTGKYVLSVNMGAEPEYFYTKDGIDSLKELNFYETALSPNVDDVVPKFVLDLFFASGIIIDTLLAGNWISINKSEPEPESKLTINLNKGWNLIGSSYDGIIEDSESIIIPNTLYAYDNSYVNSTEINANKGYWIKCNSEGKIYLNIDETTKSTNIQVNKGWNLIGSSIDGTLEDTESIIIPNTLYAYDNSYMTSTEINANKGYWIKCKNSGTIKLH